MRHNKWFTAGSIKSYQNRMWVYKNYACAEMKAASFMQGILT